MTDCQPGQVWLYQRSMCIVKINTLLTSVQLIQDDSFVLFPIQLRKPQGRLSFLFLIFLSKGLYWHRYLLVQVQVQVQVQVLVLAQVQVQTGTGLDPQQHHRSNISLKRKTKEKPQPNQFANFSFPMHVSSLFIYLSILSRYWFAIDQSVFGEQESRYEYTKPMIP